MATSATALSRKEAAAASRKRLLREIVKHKYIYLLLAPGILYLLVIKIAPIWGLSLAFIDYNPMVGFFENKWVGLRFFRELFSDPQMWLMTRNTFAISLLSLLFSFPLPIVLSIMLSEVRYGGYKRVVQSLVYLPHFMSWVVIVSVTFFLLSTDFGLVNKIIVHFFGGEPVFFLSKDQYFWPVVVFQVVWRETGWGTIIFLSALSGIDPQLYEAVAIDGAGRMQQIRHITLPSLLPTIITLFILRMGQICDVPLEQVLLMQNNMNLKVSQVYDTYAFTQGIMSGYTSIGVSVGMLKSFLSLTFVLVSNFIIKKTGNEGIF